MKVAILGAGNAGCAIAADLSLKGQEVTLIKTSNSIHDKYFKHLQENNGNIRLLENGAPKETKIEMVTKDIQKVSEAKVIIICVQTKYHENLIKRLHSHLKDGQIIMVNPGYLSTAYFLKHSFDKDIVVVETTSSFIDARLDEEHELGLVKVGFRNVRNMVGVYPISKLPETKRILAAFDYNFHYMSTVEIALHNPNMIVHTVGAIMSIPRIENTRGEYYMYSEVWTPSVWNILEKLDLEKMNVLETLKYEPISYVEACKFRNTLDDTRDAKEIFFWYANMPTRAKGPKKVDSRYISEDVAEGLVLLETLGTYLEVKTPVCTSLIEIASAAIGRDLRAEGRTIQRLGMNNIKMIIEHT